MVFTRRRLTVCVVGAMCASAPRAEGFTSPGRLAPAHGAADSFHWCAERRLAAATAGGQQRERRPVARFSMASSSRIAPAGPRVAARSGAAKAAAAVARKRAGRHTSRKSPSKGGSAADRYEAALAGIGRAADSPHSQQQHQQQPKAGEEPRATATAASATGAGAGAVANPPPAKGFRRKGNKKRASSSSDRQQKPPPPRTGSSSVSISSSSASVIDAAPMTLPPPPMSSSVDSLTAYFKTLKKIKLLKPDEEVVLGRRIQRGLQLERVRERLEASQGAAPTYEEWASTLNLSKDEMLRELSAADKAKQHMISANLRLVVSMARNYQHRGLALPDLIQEGTMGLVKATEKFNPEMGFKFYTYATWWIKQSLLTGIANQSRVIRLPTQVHAFLSSIRKYTHELTVDGKLPTDEELGDKLGATVQKIQHYRKAALRTDSISLELRQGNKKSDGVSDELGDQIGDTRNPEPEDASQAFYMKGKVTALLATLKEKERQVVRARYGLDGVTAKTLDQIGREMGFTRERVRQIEAKALSKLRQPYRNYRVREHKTGQIFVDAGLREPASEAVSAARALIAEAEGLEKQQPAVAAAGGCQPAVAAAGDRPLKIEFKQGVDASEATQAVEAVLVAALDRTPASTAAAAAAGAAVSKPNGSGRRKQGAATREAESSPGQPKVVRMAERPQPGAMLAEEEFASLGRGAAAPISEKAVGGLAVLGEDQPAPPTPVVAEAADGGRSSAEGLDVRGVTLTPDSQRLLLDVESQQQGVAGQPASSSTCVDANRQGVARGSEDGSVDAGSEQRNGAGSGSRSTFAVEPLVRVGVELPTAAVVALTPEEQRAVEIESKRKSLDKAWNKKSEAAVDRLERELAQSAAALAMLEMEQEEWERSVGDAVVVEEKSLSMASL